MLLKALIDNLEGSLAVITDAYADLDANVRTNSNFKNTDAHLKLERMRDGIEELELRLKMFKKLET